MIARPVARLLALLCVTASVALPRTPAWAAHLDFIVPLPTDQSTVTRGADADQLVVPDRGWDTPTQPGSARLPYRTVRIVLPEKIDDSLAYFLSEWRKANAYNPGREP